MSTLSPRWTFLSNHAQVLLCIAHDPAVRLRDIGDQIGITERAAHRIVGELAQAGYLSRERRGRRNHYTITADRPLPDAVAGNRKIGELLGMLTGQLTRTPAGRRSLDGRFHPPMLTLLRIAGGRSQSGASQAGRRCPSLPNPKQTPSACRMS